MSPRQIVTHALQWESSRRIQRHKSYGVHGQALFVLFSVFMALTWCVYSVQARSTMTTGKHWEILDGVGRVSCPTSSGLRITSCPLTISPFLVSNRPTRRGQKSSSTFTTEGRALFTCAPSGFFIATSLMLSLAPKVMHNETYDPLINPTVQALNTLGIETNYTPVRVCPNWYIDR
jgi:hypothetical protein